MTRFTVFTYLLLVLLVGAIISSGNLAIAKELNQPSDILAKFLSAQFSGEEDLVGYVCFSSKKIEAKTLDYHLQDGMFYDFRYDSYILVKDYRIESHKSEPKFDKFDVVYNAIGIMNSKIEHGSLINYFAELKKIEHVQYVVAKKKGKFCIIDPPNVRVSIKSILKKYQDLKVRLFDGDKEISNADTNKSKSMLKDIDAKLYQLQNIVE